MGHCSSKYKEPFSPSNSPQNSNNQATNKNKQHKKNNEVIVEVKLSPAKSQMLLLNSKSTNNSPIFTKEKASTKAENLTTKNASEGDTNCVSDGAEVANLSEKEFKLVPVRASSCTKEELDAILVQCGRLSNTSFSKVGTENGSNGNRRHSLGSNLIVDFDNEKKQLELQEEWPVPRFYSPQSRASSRRRVRSGGSRQRVSLSPGRHSGVSVSSVTSFERPRHPCKVVSVSTRERTKDPSSTVVAARKRGNEVRVIRSASPQSRKSLNTDRRMNENISCRNFQSNPTESLKHSTSKKGRQSPCRRSPMADIDQNALQGKQNNNHKRANEHHVAAMRKSEQRVSGSIAIASSIKNNDAETNCITKHRINCRSKEHKFEPEKNHENSEKQPSKKESSRQSPRKLEHGNGLSSDYILNQTSYTNLILNDINKYRKQQQTTKACSVQEAVTPISTISTYKTSEEINYKNDDILYDAKCFQVETEAQELSAESRIVTQPCVSSKDPNSLESSRPFGIEVIELEVKLSPLKLSSNKDLQLSLPDICRTSEARDRRPKATSSNDSTFTPISAGKKRELCKHHQLSFVPTGTCNESSEVHK